MDLLIIGQPTVTGVNLKDEALVSSQGKGDDSKMYRLIQGEDALIRAGIKITLTHESSGDGRVSEVVIIYLISPFRRRRARKRGWARLRIATVDTTFTHALSGYLLFVRVSKSA
jgi:hypothetical protein